MNTTRPHKRAIEVEVSKLDELTEKDVELL